MYDARHPEIIELRHTRTSGLAEDCLREHPYIRPSREARAIERISMASHPWRQTLIEWAAVACAMTVFVAAALDGSDAPVPAAAVTTASAARSG